MTASYGVADPENVTYTYDSVVSPNKGKGHLTSIADQSGSTEFVYNALGQIVSNKRMIGSLAYTTSYLYDAAGHVKTMTFPSGRVANYAYNSNGQLITVSSKLNATAANQNIATTMTYAPMSNLLTGFTHGNGLKTVASYDLDYRLLGLKLVNGTVNVSSLAYAYSDGMNLTGITDAVTPANTVSLGYTAANRLGSATGTWGQSTYSYDGVGNRIYDNNTLSSVLTTRQQSYDALSNHMVSVAVNSTANRNFTYDGAGNIVNDNRPGEAFVFTYNKRNRPSSVTRNGLAYASYGYNALEQLTTRSTSAVGGPVGTVAYLYDLDGHVIAEADATTGATTREYIWAAANDDNPVDLPLAVIDGVNTATPASLWVRTDHLGRPIRMTDATKATVWQAYYKPFGEPVTLSGSKANNLRFPGHYFQIETGLAYNWHRHYDPTTGRYTQPDPLRFVDGPNVYAYAGNSPTMKTDRSGFLSLPGGINISTSNDNQNSGVQQCTASCERAFDKCNSGSSMAEGLRCYEAYRLCVRLGGIPTIFGPCLVGEELDFDSVFWRNLNEQHRTLEQSMFDHWGHFMVTRQFEEAANFVITAIRIGRQLGNTGFLGEANNLLQKSMEEIIAYTSETKLEKSKIQNTCSFCGKSTPDVKLGAGKNVMICNECVMSFSKIFSGN